MNFLKSFLLQLYSATLRNMYPGFPMTQYLSTVQRGHAIISWRYCSKHYMVTLNCDSQSWGRCRLKRSPPYLQRGPRMLQGSWGKRGGPVGGLWRGNGGRVNSQHLRGVFSRCLSLSPGTRHWHLPEGIVGLWEDGARYIRSTGIPTDNV